MLSPKPSRYRGSWWFPSFFIIGLAIIFIGIFVFQYKYDNIQHEVVTQKEIIIGYKNSTTVCANVPCIETSYFLGIVYNNVSYIFNETTPFYCGLNDDSCQISHYNLANSYCKDLQFLPEDLPTMYYGKNPYGKKYYSTATAFYIIGAFVFVVNFLCCVVLCY